MLNRLFRPRRDRESVAPDRAALPAGATPVPLRNHDAPESVAALASAGRYAEALALVDASLARKPDDAGWMFARGSTLFDWARYHEARAWLLKAAAGGFDHPLLFLRAGWSCHWTTGARSSESWMRKTIACTPDDWLGHFGLGSSLRGQGRNDEAVTSFERALELSPGNAHCLQHLFDCRYAQGRLTEAEAFARRVLDLDPKSTSGWTNLGVVLIAQDRFVEATEAFEHAESIAPGTGGADQHLNLAICLRETGRSSEALALYERELPGRPTAGAHAHYGHTLLTAGHLPEGFIHYEFRWLQDPLLSLRPAFRKPLWSGQDLRGKTILLRCEQGIGDVVQFIRYAPQVKALGATVLLQLRKHIRELAQGFAGVDRIIDVDEPIPDFDFYIHLMSLPRVCGTDLGNIPADVPYLRAERSRVEHWRSRLHGDGGLKVGLVWAGDPGHLRDRYRSIPLARLAPLSSVTGVHFFSLQKGRGATEIAAAAPELRVIDLDADLRDFADTAAVISLLDVVICVDTSVAHLAGALGKPVWVLVPKPSDWRWLEAREDTPWYPTMRLFRQERQGEWDDVIERVQRALGEHAELQGSGQIAPIMPGVPAAPLGRVRIPVDEPSPWLTNGLSAMAETRVGIVQYWPDHDPVGPSIERYGEYLQVQLDLLARWIVPGSTIIEAAAGIGMHALFLAAAIGPGGHLLLYEDDPLRKQVLRQNLQANRIANATLMKRGLGVPVRRDAGNGSSAAGSTAGSAVETIDELRLEAVQWIKANDAAAALELLEGATDTLWRLRPKLWLAIRDHGDQLALGAKLKDFGYRCFLVVTPLFNPDNFNRRALDVFEGRSTSAMLAIPEETEIDISLDRCIEI